MRKPLSKFGVIWRETYRNNIKSGGFIAMVLMPIIMMGIFAVISGVISSETQKASNAKISIVTNEAAIVQVVESANTGLSIVPVSNEADAMEKLSSDIIDGYVVLTRDAQNEINATFNRKATSNEANLKALREVLVAYRVGEKAQQAGITAQQLSSISNTQINVAEKRLNADSLAQGIVKVDDEDSARDTLRRGVGYAVVVLMFLFVMNYAGAIGQEIATEKGTRMMEVVLSSTSAQTHFYGKFVGVILVLLTQIAIYALLFIPAYFLFGDIQKMIKSFLPSVDILSTIADMLIFAIVFSILGVLLYMSLSALFGSIVSKVEDVSKAMAPMTFVAMAGFYIGMFAVGMPNNIVVRIGSLFPLFTPFVMPLRLAAGTVAIEELLAATIITLVTGIIVLKISVMFYKTNVLIYSDKGALKAFKQSFSLLKQEKQK